ncbi:MULTISPECIES: response regulator transcription factor [Rummeliibacillus]|uniref:response regulator transcription factor n=1 Tax=Rummeliibacillus TaxID=648802 RepID=UPI0011B7F471|nr:MULTISPECIES: response regulator transcription factor [Rummeliibacillus]MBO2536627.1 response regulator transcription factor [Rummeliibacillus suwonensis]
MTFNILLIEDDEAISKLIQKHFLQWDMQAEVPNDFKNVISTFHKIQPQLVIIDIQLPAFDGFHWCREIRSISKVPILFLSSRDQPMDMVMAMQMGADDYIQKPFNMDVLLAKVQAILRRTYDYTEETVEHVIWNGATIDYSMSSVTKDNQTIELTKNEQFILRILLEHKDQIVSRDDLMRKLWDDERFVNDNTLTVNVNRLRGKLEELSLTNVIITKKGLGYMAVTKDVPH